KWDAERYYTDEKYYLDKSLVRPYRVGMACAFCHVGPNPVKPPDDPENPKWENLSSNVGAQYFWVDRIFTWKYDPSNYMFQLLHSSRPGSLDTSLVSNDYLNNPRTMNAVYNLGPRLAMAKRWGKETLTGGGLENRQFNDYVKDGPLTEFFQRPHRVDAPRAQGWRRLRGRARRPQSRLSQHRAFQRGVAPALQRPRGGHAHLAYRDCRGPQELCVLAGHGNADAVYGAVFPQERQPALSEGRPRGRRLPHARGGHPHPGQDRLRGALRALPLEQGPARCPRPRSCGLRRVRLHVLLAQVLGMDEDRRVQAADA